LLWFPQLILKKGYDETQAIIVVAIWGCDPGRAHLAHAGLGAAAGRAGIPPFGHRRHVVEHRSLAATLVLLLLAGPVASLGGVLIGELLMTTSIFRCREMEAAPWLM
jgi:hypothetical protein